MIGMLLLLILAAIVSAGARNLLAGLMSLVFGCILLIAGCVIA
jgi:hypothetical protein